MEEKTYYERLFEETAEEKEINGRIEEEMSRYRNTEAYKEHTAKLDALLGELKEAGKRRRDEAKKYRPERTAPKKLTEDEMAVVREINENRREKRIASYPEPLRKAIMAYEELGDTAKKVFNRETWNGHGDVDKYENPVTTEKDIRELLQILVQDTIDFISERGLTDIYSIGFGVDELQSSAKSGEWVSDTDASINVMGLGKVKDSDGHVYAVQQEIGYYM